MSWINEEHKFNFHIIMPFLVGELLFSKEFIIPEHNSNHFNSVSNGVKQGIHAIEKQKTYYVMACYTEISSVANTVNKL